MNAPRERGCGLAPSAATVEAAVAARPCNGALAARRPPVVEPSDRPRHRGDAWGARFEDWREQGALVWRPEFFGGAWVVTRHAEAQAALRDPRLSARRTGAWVMPDDDARQQLRGLQALVARSLLFVDAPDHGRLRALLAPAFAPAAMQALADGIAADTEALAAQAERQTAAGDGTVDLVAALTRPLPARVIGRCLGLADTDGADFLAWSEALADFLAAPQPERRQSLAAQRALLAMVEPLDAVARQCPDSLPGRWQAALADGRLHDRQELLAQAVTLLFAGYETTRHLLGTLLATLLAAPEGWTALRTAQEAAVAAASATPTEASSPSAPRGPLAAVVREALRRDCPVRYTARRVAQDFDWCGQRLRRGQPLVIALSAALRDPRQFDAPLAWRPARGPGWALAFGSGPHVCLGAALTQLEAETVLRVLLRRWPLPRLARALTDADWIDGPLYRGLRRLPVQLSDAR